MTSKHSLQLGTNRVVLLLFGIVAVGYLGAQLGLNTGLKRQLLLRNAVHSGRLFVERLNSKSQVLSLLSDLTTQLRAALFGLLGLVDLQLDANGLVEFRGDYFVLDLLAGVE